MSIDYELAKELKSAGFHQNTRYASVLSPWCKVELLRTTQTMTREKDNDGYANLLSAGYDVVSLPTLEELIEACGAKFGMLGYYTEGGQPSPDKAWKAFGSGSTAYAATPISAVAMLWIALNPNL